MYFTRAYGDNLHTLCTLEIVHNNDKIVLYNGATIILYTFTLQNNWFITGLKDGKFYVKWKVVRKLWSGKIELEISKCSFF